MKRIYTCDGDCEKREEKYIHASANFKLQKGMNQTIKVIINATKSVRVINE